MTSALILVHSIPINRRRPHYGVEFVTYHYGVSEPVADHVPKPEPLAVDSDPKRFRELAATPTLRVRHQVAVVALIAFALAFYYRITGHLFTKTWPSDMRDGASFTWNFWYLPSQVLQGRDPFVTNDIFYPLGAPLGFHTYTPLVSLLSWPLVKIFGLTTTFSIITLLGPTLSGIGAYFLAHHVTKNRWASFVAGAAYIALPDRALRMGGHVNLNQTYMLPIALLCLFKFYEKPTKRNAVLLGLSLGVSLLIDSTFAAFLVIAAVVVILWKWRRTLSGEVVRAWLLAGVVALAVASPVLLAMLRDLTNRQLDPLPGWGGAPYYSADVFSYLVPSKFNPVTGSWFESVYDRVTAGEKFRFVGWTVLALAFIAALKWANTWKRIIIAMTLVFFILSLGPFLHVLNKQGKHFEYAGYRFDLPLPYLAIHFIPVLNGVRVPARFGLMVGLLLAILAAGGLTWIINHLQTRRDGATTHDDRRWVAPVVAVIALSLVTIESLPGDVPKLTDSTIPAPYTAIKNDPGKGAVLEIPMQWRDGFGQTGDNVAHRDDTIFMYYAITHGKPLVGGMVARYPDAREVALKSIPIYAQVLSLQGDSDPIPVTFTTNDLRQLGIGYIVAHRDRPLPLVNSYVDRLKLPILADDGNTVVWKVPA